MRYQETRDQMLRDWPSLFADEGDVLYHLFFVAGNGFKWVGGELVEKYPEQGHPEDERCTPGPRKMYPLSESSLIITTPANVADDWLQAAKKAIEAAEKWERTLLDDYWLAIARAHLLTIELNWD